MPNNHILRKIIEYLRKPFIQRLIILILSTLLATSLSCAAIVQPESGHDVALSQPVIASPEREAFAFNMHVERRATGQATTPRTGGRLAQRRPS